MSSPITWDNAYEHYEDEFTAWLYDNYIIGNGHQLTKLMEDTTKFDKFMADRHPEIEND